NDERAGPVTVERYAVKLAELFHHAQIDGGHAGNVGSRQWHEPAERRVVPMPLDDPARKSAAARRQRIGSIRLLHLSALRLFGGLARRFGHGLRLDCVEFDRVARHAALLVGGKAGGDLLQIGERPCDRLGEWLAPHAAACCAPTTMSTSSAIAAISRAAGPFPLIRLGGAPPRGASGEPTRLIISLCSTRRPAAARSARVCLAITESRVVWVSRQRNSGRRPSPRSTRMLSVSSMRSTSNGDGLTGTSRKSATARQSSVVLDRKPGVSMMTRPPPAASRRAVLAASSVASSTTATPPTARSRATSRRIERCGSASVRLAR